MGNAVQNVAAAGMMQSPKDILNVNLPAAGASPMMRAPRQIIAGSGANAGGVVTNPGATGFDYRGNRMAQTTGSGGAPALEYNPAQDATKPVMYANGQVVSPRVGPDGTPGTIVGGPRLAPGAKGTPSARGIFIDPKYQTPGASNMAVISGGTVSDARGNTYDPASGALWGGPKAPALGTPANPIVPQPLPPAPALVPQPMTAANVIPPTIPPTPSVALGGTAATPPVVPPAPPAPLAFRAGQAVSTAVGAPRRAAEATLSGIGRVADTMDTAADNFFAGFKGQQPVNPAAPVVAVPPVTPPVDDEEEKRRKMMVGQAGDWGVM